MPALAGSRVLQCTVEMVDQQDAGEIGIVHRLSASLCGGLFGVRHLITVRGNAWLVTCCVVSRSILNGVVLQKMDDSSVTWQRSHALPCPEVLNKVSNNVNCKSKKLSSLTILGNPAWP
jgi:hypothetical protein